MAPKMQGAIFLSMESLEMETFYPRELNRNIAIEILTKFKYRDTNDVNDLINWYIKISTSFSSRQVDIIDFNNVGLFFPYELDENGDSIGYIYFTCEQ